MGSDEVAEVADGEQSEGCHSGGLQLVAADSGARSPVKSGGGHSLRGVVSVCSVSCDSYDVFGVSLLVASDFE